jgi:NhaP-type Na+/H+ and K+/H+ antiporter
LPWRERLFTGWVGLRGAVPIVLATYPALRGVPAGDQGFHLVFFVVLVNAFIPGATVAWAARWLGLSRAPQPTPAATIGGGPHAARPALRRRRGRRALMSSAGQIRTGAELDNRTPGVGQ